MRKLRKAVLEQIVFCINEFSTLEELCLKTNHRRLVLETRQFECFHNLLIITQRLASNAIGVQADNLRWPSFVAKATLVLAVGEFLIDRNPCACPQLFECFCSLGDGLYLYLVDFFDPDVSWCSLFLR